MPKISVELPPDDLIEPNLLVKAIVNALYPEKTEGLKGIDCINGKWVQITDAKPPAKKTDLFGEVTEQFWENRFCEIEPSSQHRLPLPEPKMTQNMFYETVEDEKHTKFWLPFPLTDDDYSKLNPILESLPPLVHPMTDGEVSRFTDAYLAYPGRPKWVPAIITCNDISRRLEVIAVRTEQHKEAIRQAIEDGALSAFDCNRVPTKTLVTGAQILRSSAVEYLKRCGLSVRGESKSTVCTDDEQEIQDAVKTKSGTKVQNKVGGGKWTIEELQAIRDKLSTVDPTTGKNYTNLGVAKLIGLTSASRITQLMKALEQRCPTPTDSMASQLIQVSRSVKALI